jgi:hypothetical protein
MLSQDAGFFFQSTRPCYTIFYSLRHFTSGKRTKQIVVVEKAEENVLSSELHTTVGRFEASGTSLSYLWLAQLNINGNL